MNDPSRIDDERRLRAAILRGDAAAWELLHGRSFDPHAAWTRQRCGTNAELADEVIQESWMIALRRIRRFDPLRGTFQAWMRGITANVLRDRIRREAREVHAPLGEPVALDEALDESERISLAMVQLLPEQREVLRAKYVERHSVAEIAERLGRSPKAVESLLTRARSAFRVAWSQL